MVIGRWQKMKVKTIKQVTGKIKAWCYNEKYWAEIKYGEQTLQLAIKTSIFNKINNSLIVDAFKDVFQIRSSEDGCPKGRDNPEYMLHNKKNLEMFFFN